MTGDSSAADGRDQQLQSILVAYIEAVEKGQAPSRDELLARHPDFAAEFSDFLDIRTLASGSADGTIRLWNTATGRLLLILRGPTQDIAFRRDSRLLASDAGGEIRLWPAPEH